MKRLWLGVVLSAATAGAQGLTAAAPVESDVVRDAEAAALAGRREVSLTEALAIAARKSPDLLAARAQAEQVVARTRLVFSAMQPELKASVSYVHTSAEQKFALSSFSDAFTSMIDANLRGTSAAFNMPPNEAVIAGAKEQFRRQTAGTFTDTTIVATNSLYGTFTLTQLLFTPQMLLIPSVGDAQTAARAGSKEAREQVLLGVARLYLGLEGLEDIEKAARDAEVVAARREQDAQAQANAGTSTEINVLRAQVERAQARSLVAQLAGQKVALLALLEAVVGEAVRPLEGQPTHVDVTPGAEAQEPWGHTWLVQSQQAGLAAQSRFNTYDRVAWAPTVLAQGKASYNSNSGFSGKNWIFDGIVAAEWKLYDRGERYVSLHENDAKTVMARAQLDGSKAKAKATWAGAKANLMAAEVSLVQAQAQATLAARAQRQAEGARSVGMMTALELSDIDSKRFLAASAVAQARSQLEVRKVEVLAAEGRLAQALGLADE